MTQELFDRAKKLKDSIETLDALSRCASSGISIQSFDSKNLLVVNRTISGPLRKDFLEFAYAKKEEYEKEFESL